MAGVLDMLQQYTNPFFQAYASAYGTDKAAAKVDKAKFLKYGQDAYGNQTLAGFDQAGYDKAVSEFQQSAMSALQASQHALDRRQIRGKDWKPDIFDALTQRWQDAELNRLGANSTRGMFFSRPAGLPSRT